EPVQLSRKTGSRSEITEEPPNRSSSPYETYDISHPIHDRGSDLLCPARAVAKYAIDLRGVPGEPAHLRADRANLRHGQITESLFERRERPAAELPQHGGHVHSGKRSIDADEVLRLGPPGEPQLLGRQRLRIRLRLLDLAGDRVGIVSQVDAGEIRGVRL